MELRQLRADDHKGLAVPVVDEEVYFAIEALCRQAIFDTSEEDKGQ